MRMLASVCLFILTTVPAGAVGYGRADDPRDIEPIELGRLFCESRVRGDMQPLERFFAPKLANLLAEIESSRLAAGIPWQGSEYPPSSCTVEILNGFDDTIGVLVQISYQASQARWSDVINLERTPDSWLINNVFYDGGGNLRFRLFEALN